ncbi:MAG TPA: antibiotic biosynthesis monooxygenase [Bryobacteraceae bacterium]|jgi:quinol monooxygenase YgiN|nr:antibiotic biosynthesis monooxygenase [Bryobacteraceae bacterium]
MIIFQVHIHVKPEAVDDFRAATIENARNSVQESGIAQFAFLQDPNDPTKFLLIEAYRTTEAQAAHRETKHYQIWRDAVAGMMAEPRAGIRYESIFPADENW